MKDSNIFTTLISFLKYAIIALEIFHKGSTWHIKKVKDILLRYKRTLGL